MPRNPRLKQATAGFTLIEALVIVIIIGVLAAIASPGWLAFMNRQRLGRTGEQLAQALRLAQSEAKRTSTYREVHFDTTSDPPRFAVVKSNFDRATSTVSPATAVSNWEVLGQNNIRQNTIQLAVNQAGKNSIIFGPKGEVVNNTLAPNNPTPKYIVTVSLQKSPSSKRCVKVETLLGAISQGEDDQCDR
jgi:Tfp pilus assembly protein FimT